MKTSFGVREISSQAIDLVFVSCVTLTSLIIISLKYKMIGAVLKIRLTQHNSSKTGAQEMFLLHPFLFVLLERGMTLDPFDFPFTAFPCTQKGVKKVLVD